jgi:hypothetical protein
MPEDWYSIAAAEKCRVGCLQIDKVPTVSVIGYQATPLGAFSVQAASMPSATFTSL